MPSEQDVDLEEFFGSVRGRLRTSQVKGWMDVLERQRRDPAFVAPVRAPSHAVQRAQAVAATPAAHRAEAAGARSSSRVLGAVGGMRGVGLLVAGFAAGAAVASLVLKRASSA